MLNNLNIQPNAAINCWITGILLFDFTLKHILESRHAGPSGLLYWCHALEDKDKEDSKDVKEWIDKVLGCGIWELVELHTKDLGIMT